MLAPFYFGDWPYCFSAEVALRAPLRRIFSGIGRFFPAEVALRAPLRRIFRGLDVFLCPLRSPFGLPRAVLFRGLAVFLSAEVALRAPLRRICLGCSSAIPVKACSFFFKGQGFFQILEYCMPTRSVVSLVVLLEVSCTLHSAHLLSYMVLRWWC